MTLGFNFLQFFTIIYHFIICNLYALLFVLFIAYHTTQKQFDDEAHIRAWLIRVAINKAKNIKKSAWYRKTVPLEEYMESLTFVSEASQISKSG